MEEAYFLGVINYRILLYVNLVDSLLLGIFMWGKVFAHQAFILPYELLSAAQSKCF